MDAGLVFIMAMGFAAQLLPPYEPSVLKALNQVRADPARYAAVLRQQRPYYRGKDLDLPGRPELITHEGVRALDEAIAELQSMHTGLAPVVLSKGLSHAAADHVLDTGRRGITGHNGADGSTFTQRIGRYGTWVGQSGSGEIGEDIAYGARDAREVIANLLVDDGVPDRGHRKSLLNPRWRYVGIACGLHSVYGTMCVLDFASNYRDR